MNAILRIIGKAATVYCVTVALGLGLWTCAMLMSRVYRPSDGSEFDGPLPADTVAQIERHLQGGVR